MDVGIGILCLAIGIALIVFVPRISLALIQARRELYDPLMRSGDSGRMRGPLGGLYPDCFTYKDGSRKERILRAFAAAIVLLFAAGFIAVGIVSL